MEGDEFSLRTSSPRIVSKAPPKTPEKLSLPQLSTSSKGLSQVEIARQLLREELAMHKKKKKMAIVPPLKKKKRGSSILKKKWR